MQSLDRRSTHRPARRQPALRLRQLALACAVAAGSAPAWGIDHVWLGGNGNWDDVTKWSFPGVPGSGDRATISTGIVTLSGPREVGELTMGGGTLTGSSIRVLGDAILNSGTHSGPGTSEFVGRTVFNPGLRVFAGGRTAEMLFETYWTDSAIAGDNTIRLNGTATLVNRGTWVDGNGHDNAMLADGVGTRTFVNIGSYRKLGGGHSVLNPIYRNEGHVEVALGRLSLRGGDTHTGSFEVASGATLSFGSDAASSGTARFDGSQITGTGTLMVDARPGIGTDVQITGTSRFDGTFNLQDGQLEILGHYTVARLVQMGGDLFGNGTLIVEGAHALDAGRHTGSGTSRFLGDVTLGDGTRLLGQNRTIETFANVVWRDDVRDGSNGLSDFRFQDRATWINHGHFDDRNDLDALISTGGAGGPKTFVNEGSFLKSGSGTTVMQPIFLNRGTVVVADGRLSLRGGTAHTGSFDIAEGATLALGHEAASVGTHELAVSQVTGPGRLLVDGTSGIGIEARLTGGGAFSGQLDIRSGTLQLTGATTVALFEQSGGLLEGSDLSVIGTATLSGGRQQSLGLTLYHGPLTITAQDKITVASGRRMETAGETWWTGNSTPGANAIQLAGADATLVNTGHWIDSNAQDSAIAAGGAGSGKLFINHGSYDKVGLSTTTVEVAFRNTGTLRVHDGAVVHVTHAEFLNSGTLAGRGTLRVADGSTLLSNGIVGPGLSTGTLTIDGDMILQAASWLDIELTSPADHDLLAIGGSLTLGGDLHIVNLGYAPAVGDQFVIVTFEQRLENSVFAGLTWSGFGSGMKFEVIYNPNDVTLGVLAVPEPGTWALWLAGVAGVAAVRRRRMRAGA